MERPSSGKHSKAKNCAECRRLKIRCDRTVPCVNCQRRGTASICPDGTLLPKGHRVILSSSDNLPSRIEELTARIRELEDALATLQAAHSEEPHPLLLHKTTSTTPVSEPSTTDKSLVQGFGALVIGQRGNERFFGPTGTMEWTVFSDTPDPVTQNQPQFTSQASLPSGTAGYQDLENPQFLLHSLTEDWNDMSQWHDRVINGLPERKLAEQLMGAYYRRAAWETCPVTRKPFVEEYFAPCYESLGSPSITMHALGLVYGVLAIGALHSHEIPSNGALARQLISNSQACLKIDDCLANTNVTVINTLLLHVAYYYMSDDGSLSEATNANTPYPISATRSWVTLGVAMKLAVAIGLHREPSIWGLPAKEVTNRRRAMWELISIDLWSALIGGRPPFLARQHVDVQMPLDHSDPSDSDPAFYLGKYHFSKSCLWDIADLGLASPSAETYIIVLKLDTKIRQWKLPEELNSKGYKPTEEQKTFTAFRTTTEMIFREVTLMCLHRCYCASALLSPAFDLHTSPYARSILSIYASSCAILSRVRALYAVEPVTSMRFGFFWTHAFSAAVILGAIVIRAPDCTLAATSLSEFDLAVEMFKEAQAGYRARRGLPKLLQLQASVHTSMNAFREGTWSRDNIIESQLLKDLGGSGAVVYHQLSPQDNLLSSSIATMPNQGSTLADIAPSFDEYLRSFDFGGATVEMEGQEYGPPSDEFLHGVLGGNWGSLFPPAPDTGASPSSNDYSSHRDGSVPPYANTAYSDGESSTNEPIVANSGVGQPPSLLYAENFRMGGSGYEREEELRKSLLWENFLQELGIS